MTTAIIVGSGPNGLAAGAILARAGVDVTVLEAAETIGGGTRSSEMIVPGLLHDHCSAFHPVAAASPIVDELQLESYGLRWLAPEIDCVHPLDDGSAGVLHRSIERTAEGLGVDGPRWRRFVSTLTTEFPSLFADATQPILRLPSHPVLVARFGIAAAMPATVLARRLETEQAKALWAGVAAHALSRLDRPMTSPVGLMILLAGHTRGWVVAEGGSQAIADSLASVILEHGGTIETGHRVDGANSLPPSDALLLDLAPSAVADLLGDRLPARVARAYRRFRHGPGAFKVDFAVEGGVPWAAMDARKAGTVHLGGDAEEVVAGELALQRGSMPDRPFVLVGQQYLADPGRSVGDVHPLWTYAHVPHGYTGDATEAILTQIERFAPGVRDRIVGSAVRTTTEMSAYNPNFVGGDIIGGASTLNQLLFRPRFALDPYSTGIPGTYLCSASTPPGAGAHGLCGANAAARALADLGIAR
ncbi:MAG: phytoene desaturase family protein [Acidimicrobiales bacterium]